MMRPPLHLARSAGVGLVTAIFLLVVLAGLAVAMVSLYTTQQASSNLDLEGARAYQAARAGIEYGLFRRLRGACTAAGCCPGAASQVTLAMPGDGGLRGFVVVVSCTQAGGRDTPANITAVACNMADSQGLCEGVPGNNPQYVRRRMEVSA
jgi:MSHA biogenesis protein MshP